MNRSKKIMGMLLILTMVILTNGFPAKAAVVIPDKVRIGLYYDTTAVTSVNINADKGIQLGFVKNNAFTVLYEETTAKAVTVKKNIYYIKIGGNLNSLAEATAKIQEYKGKGINAYLVYTDAWQIGTGYYADTTTAQNDMNSYVKPMLGEVSCSVVAPTSTQIVCTAADNSMILVFDSTASYFQIHPRVENLPYKLKINGKGYRGDVEVRRFSNSDMTIINVVGMEDYIYGVVPNEIGASVPAESLKAQAVAARTYAVCNLNSYKKWDFNLCNTESSQVYKGYDSEFASTNKAVDDTKGKVLTYNGSPAMTFYSASNGGYVEDPRYVWGTNPPIPYLKSIQDLFDPVKPYTSVLAASKIKEITKNEIGDILSVEATKRVESGRVVELVIKGSNGQKTYTNGSCRSTLGLNSQMYTISTDVDIWVKGEESQASITQLPEKKVITSGGMTSVKGTSGKITVLGANGKKKTIPSVPTTYTFNQKGKGHGVGMSQEGVIARGKSGQTYEEILTFYFPGTVIQ